MVANTHIDDKVLTDQPINLIRAGKWNQVPVMVGTTRDEMAMMFALIPGASLYSRAQIRDVIRKIIPARADDILALYNFDDYRRPIKLLGAMTADAFGSRGLALAEAATASQPVYWYRFDWDEERMSKTMGSFHGLELPFVFGNLELKNSALGLLMKRKSLPDARKLSETMMGYWSNFARSGDPNGPGLPEWRRFSADTPERQLLDVTVRPGRPEGREWKRLDYFSRVAFSEFERGAIPSSGCFSIGLTDREKAEGAP